MLRVMCFVKAPFPARHRKHELAQALRAGSSAGIVMYYTYVLKSIKDDKLYIGYSDNLKKRLKEHNDGSVPSTKGRRPFILVYYEACLDKDKALAREKYFKTGFGRRYLETRL